MHNFLTVGLGASAGGILALQNFFKATAPDTGIAYVVILHLSPNYNSQLAEVLQAVTPMPVLQVEEKTHIEPDHIYVIPPDKHLTIEGRDMAVSKNLTIEERRAPVDIFLRSLAETHEENAICVILSGTGADGSMGLKRIKEKGGTVFVQNPREAEFTDMPRSAISTDLVDDVLNVAEIPAKIIAFRDGRGTIHLPDEQKDPNEDAIAALDEIFAQLRQQTGHDFSNYKHPTLLRRIERRINVRNLKGIPEYAAFMAKFPQESQALLKDLLISVTNFFRGAPAFKRLQEDVLPKLLAEKDASDELRIWVPACATGEEAYSIAMLCADLVAGKTEVPKIQIIATDIDEAAIGTARDGLYTINDAADIPQDLLARHFSKEGDNYRIRREIRETILFAPHNFLKDPPFSRLDLISCRNVLIYLNHEAQGRLMQTFHFALKPGAYLFLGMSESVDGAGELFTPAYREEHIWQSRQVVARRYSGPEFQPIVNYRSIPDKKVTAANKHVHVSFGELHQRMLELYAPPSLVLNEDYNIVHLSNQAVQYLQLTGGEPSQNILKIVRDELRADLRNALYQAARQSISTATRQLKVRLNDVTETIIIHVRPALAKDIAQGFILVIFEAVADETGSLPVIMSRDTPASVRLDEEVLRLKLQLRTSNEQHEYAADEMKAGNEELQALNEEMRSSSEELETSKEELQSVNEELATVNQELKVKVEESGMISNNLRNIINSTDVGTIILDRSHRVMLFSPAAKSIYNLILADHSRPLSDITNKIIDNTLIEDAGTVLNTLHSVEREIDTTDFRSFLVRISPYRTEADQILGVVLTFLDITDRRRQELNLSFLAEISAEFAPIGNAQAIMDMVGERLATHMHLSRCSFSMANEDADLLTSVYEWKRDELCPSSPSEIRISETLNKKAKQLFRIGQPIIINDVARDPVGSISPEILAAMHVESMVDVPHLEGESWKFLITVCRDTPSVWRADELSLIRELAARIYIRIQRAQTEEALQRTVERLELAASVSGFGIQDYDIASGRYYWSPELRALLGLPAATSLSHEEVIQAVHPEDQQRVANEMNGSLSVDGSGQVAQEFRIVRQDNAEVRWLYNLSRTSFEGEGSSRLALRSTGIMMDITERKRNEEALRESEERLRVTVESAADYAIITMDPQGFIGGWSKGAELALGWTEAEVLGMKIDVIFSPEDQLIGRPEEERELARNTGHAIDERWHIRKDGTRFFMSGVMRPIMDRQLTGFVKVARDLTEQRKEEESLRISEERYRTSLQAAGMGAWDWNMVSGKVVWNEQHYLMLGLVPEAGEQDDNFFLQFVHPEDSAAVNAALELAADETGLYQAEFRITRADNGATCWMAGFGRTVLMEEDRPVRMVGVMYDITARRHLEEQREDFINNASHELKTPLTALKAYAEVLQETFEEAGDAQSAGLIGKMDGQIDRLNDLIRSLLDVTNMREGRLELSAGHFYLEPLLKEAADEIGLLATQQIVVDSAPAHHVVADRQRIRQVLLNLLSNAVKYSSGAEQIIVTSKEEDGMVTVCVQDFGIGMNEEEAKHVFERFYRSDLYGSAYPGLGLGLYISAEIIAKHHGRIWVESKEGKGSTFCFSLPCLKR